MAGDDEVTSTCSGVGALVMFSGDPERCVAFYRSIGIPLAQEQHDAAGPVHYACELGDVHVAVFAAEGTSEAAAIGEPGCSFAGFVVASVDAVVDAARRAGSPILQEPAEYPWGRRAVLRDPDGRPIEVFTRPDDRV